MENTDRKVLDLDGEAFKSKFSVTVDGVLVDVRTPVEFYEGTLAGAINLDFMSKAFDDKVKTLDFAKTYFVFCRNGNRSHAACKIMARQGLKVINLKEGIGAKVCD